VEAQTGLWTDDGEGHGEGPKAKRIKQAQGMGTMKVFISYTCIV
jgi:hypothetical protein